MSQTINTTPLIQATNLAYSDGQRSILQGVNLSLMPDQIVSIIGPNGAGKTTLIKLLVGLLAPTVGKIQKKAQLTIGYMPQRLHIDPIFPLTVARFLSLGLTCSQALLRNMLAEVGVLHALDSPLQAISGGEFQRVLLARALLRKPQLLVLDEPAQGVDLIGQGELYDLIANIKDKYHCGILLVSHDLNIVMARTDMVVCLNQHVCCSGHPEQVSRDPAFAALFGKAAAGLAFYTHRHDHHHDVYGHIIDPDKEKP
ncbi:MAG: ATP-binding cassette domain-containing protein [Proteobacteria bacterium]|nr:ATP-binding cassette domain-containing protein [Pseudomonadota bacterium]